MLKALQDLLRHVNRAQFFRLDRFAEMRITMRIDTFPSFTYGPIAVPLIEVFAALLQPFPDGR